MSAGAVHRETASRMVHVVGAGLAGLACAIALARRGCAVALFEATDHGGGRCRSFFDATLGRVIDNGNHLILTGNDAARDYLAEIGAAASLVCPPRAVFPFLDLKSGERWTLRPSRGPIPWWIFAASRRVPGTRARDYLAAWRLARASADATVAECFDAASPIYARFWRPLTVAALNTVPERAAARLLWPVIAQTFGRGETACRPCLARDGLSATFVEPAIAFLQARGVAVNFRRRLTALEVGATRVRALAFGGEKVPVDEDDAVVLALPPASIADLLPQIPVPRDSSAILNIHFRLPRAPAPLPGGSHLLGLVGGTSEWLFLRGDVASVTMSAADRFADADAGALAARVWPEVARALSFGAQAMPPYRVVKERRATFSQTPAALALRAATRTAIHNLFLAGDWIDTGLPATIEGAIRSGRAAAAAASGAPA